MTSNTRLRARSVAAALVGLSTLLVSGHADAISVTNPSFDMPNPAVPFGSPATTYAVCDPTGTPGISASAGWTTYANTPTTDINSWLVGSPGGFISNLVAVGGPHGGLVQVMAPQCETTDVNRVSAWIYVVAGQAVLQLGNGGAGGGSSGVTTTTGTWEYVQACARPDMLNNEITIYGAGPAVFYADFVSVDYTDDCLVCAHSAYATGKPLDTKCGGCEATICAVDPYCCTTAWDAACVSQAVDTCGECGPLS